jgi:hypothetical protein
MTEIRSLMISQIMDFKPSQACWRGARDWSKETYAPKEMTAAVSMDVAGKLLPNNLENCYRLRHNGENFNIHHRVQSGRQDRGGDRERAVDR